jgi:CRP-like cAMP-binding protein
VVDKVSREIGRFLFEALREEGISLDDAMSVAQTTRTRIVPRGGFIYQRHQPHAPGDDSIFIVQQGSVELTLPIRAGREVRLGKAGSGSILGGLGSVIGMLPLESAQANEETVLLEVSKSAYAYLKIAKPLLAHWLGQVILGGHLRRMDGVVSRLGDSD